MAYSFYVFESRFGLPVVCVLICRRRYSLSRERHKEEWQGVILVGHIRFYLTVRGNVVSKNSPKVWLPITGKMVP